MENLEYHLLFILIHSLYLKTFYIYKIVLWLSILRLLPINRSEHMSFFLTRIWTNCGNTSTSLVYWSQIKQKKLTQYAREAMNNLPSLIQTGFLCSEEMQRRLKKTFNILLSNTSRYEIYHKSSINIVSREILFIYGYLQINYYRKKLGAFHLIILSQGDAY